MPPSGPSPMWFGKGSLYGWLSTSSSTRVVVYEWLYTSSSTRVVLCGYLRRNSPTRIALPK
jgi:hypothetical protein